MIKKSFVAALIFILSASTAYSFEFYGIKPGMSPAEIAVLFSVKEKEIKSVTGIFGDALKKNPQVANSEWIQIRFHFTDKDQLWRIIARTMVSRSSVLETIAIEAAIKEKYIGHLVEKTTERSDYGPIEYFDLFLIDKKLSEESVKRYKESFKSKI